MAAPIRGEGRAMFAGILLLMVGFFNLVYGIALIAKDEIVATGPASQVVLVGDVTAWGWWALVFGAVEIMAGLAIAAGQTWARAVGIVAAFFAALGQLPLIGGPTPIWSLIVVFGCVWIIHGLIVYGEPVE